MSKQDKLKILPLVIYCAAAGLFIAGVKVYQENARLKPQNILAGNAIAKIKKEMVFLERFPTREPVPLEENFRRLKVFAKRCAGFYNINYSVRVVSQTDHSRINDYMREAGMPGIKQLDLAMELGSRQDPWRTVQVLRLLFHEFPLELAAGLTGPGKSAFILTSDAAGQIKLECRLTLYGI